MCTTVYTCGIFNDGNYEDDDKNFDDNAVVVYVSVFGGIASDKFLQRLFLDNDFKDDYACCYRVVKKLVVAGLCIFILSEFLLLMEDYVSIC